MILLTLEDAALAIARRNAGWPIRIASKAAGLSGAGTHLFYRESDKNSAARELAKTIKVEPPPKRNRPGKATPSSCDALLSLIEAGKTKRRYCVHRLRKAGWTRGQIASAMKCSLARVGQILRLRVSNSFVDILPDPGLPPKKSPHSFSGEESRLGPKEMKSIKTMLAAGTTKTEIARAIGRSRTTLYKAIARMA